MDGFRSFSVTKTGVKHEDGVCQDASKHKDLGSAAIAVVADGHGSSRCFRSDVGAEQVVRITTTCIESFIKDSKNALRNPSEDENNDGNDGKAELRGLGRQIIDRWCSAVLGHEKASPLVDDPRIEVVPEKYKDRYIDDPDYRCHAYGTTLMAVAMTEAYWFGIQIGDGKCVALYEDGTWAFPIPLDDRCSHNITTSICDDEPVSALEELRCWFGFKDDDGRYVEYTFGVDGQNRDSGRRTVASRPLAIFIGSDGVEDSYPSVDNDRYMVHFYRNRVISIFDDGVEPALEGIEEWGKWFANHGSTDDVSIAGVIGDFTGKATMIESFRKESKLHETSEAVSAKRRDADEKKRAYESVLKRATSANDDDDRESLEAKLCEIKVAWEEAENSAVEFEEALRNMQ
jgi:hypothetical protein